MKYEEKQEDALVLNDGERRDLRERTKEYALGIIRLYVSLPKEAVSQVLGKQMLRSGTSVEPTIEKPTVHDQHWSSSQR